MSKYADILGMNTEDAENVALAYEWRAKILSEERLKDRLPVIASCYLISALFNVLFDTVKSRELFSLAAEHYRELRLPIWRVLAICSQTQNSDDLTAPVKSDADNFYRLLQAINNDSDWEQRGFKITSDVLSDLSIPGRIDRINIPYRLVISALREAQQQAADWVSKPKLTNFSAVLDRFAELIQQYQEDTFHWQHIQGPIIPFEPEVLAITVVLVKMWMKKVEFEKLTQMIENLNIQQNTLLQIAYDLIKVER